MSDVAAIAGTMQTHRIMANDGVPLVYRELGAREATPIVLCHGMAAGGEQMLDDARYFADRGYRVLVPDLRGHGLSGRPIDKESRYSIAQMASDLGLVLDHASARPVHWVGNSLGGIVALHMLRSHPGRMQTLATYGTAYRLGLSPLLPALLPLGYRLAGGKLIGWTTARQTTRHKPAWPVIAKLVADFDPRVARHVAANLVRYDLLAHGQEATLPILLLRGGRDGAVNAVLGPTISAMQGKPNFTLVEVPEGGHCANLDATDMVRAELERFWARVA